jgi:hypothetical protein
MEILRDIAHDATLKASIFINKKMPRLMLYLYQYELLARKIYREITLEATSFSSSCMSQLLQLFNWRQGFSREMALKATAFADSCMSQLLLVLFPYESDLLLFGVLNCVLQPAFFLYIFLPEFEDEYHLFPNEVDNFGDEQFLGIAHIVMSVGFGGTAYIATSTCFSIVEFVTHFWSKLLGYSLVIVAGVAPLFSSIGYLLFVHDGRYETGLWNSCAGFSRSWFAATSDSSGTVKLPGIMDSRWAYSAQEEQDGKSSYPAEDQPDPATDEDKPRKKGRKPQTKIKGVEKSNGAQQSQEGDSSARDAQPTQARQKAKLAQQMGTCHAESDPPPPDKKKQEVERG